MEIKKELVGLLKTLKINRQDKYPQIAYTKENEIWIHCGMDEKSSEKISSHIRASEKFNQFLDKHEAVCGLHRKKNYKGVMVWRLQVRY